MSSPTQSQQQETQSGKFGEPWHFVGTELRELELAVDAAMGVASPCRCSKCGEGDAIWRHNLLMTRDLRDPSRLTCWSCNRYRGASDVEMVRVPSRAWSTDREAVGAMMEWINTNCPRYEDEGLCVSNDWYGEAEDVVTTRKWTIGGTISAKAYAEAESLPHALALAVVEVARRAARARAELVG